MSKLRFQRHSRIQEWVAEELGVFAELGLEYDIAHGEVPNSPEAAAALASLPQDPQPSAYRDFLLKSTLTNIASTSHWAVDTAISAGFGRLWPHAYSVMPAGIYVSPGTRIGSLQDLAKMEIVAGRHSGSHYSALHALRAFLPAQDIHLKFIAGRGERLDYLLGQERTVGSIYGQEAYALEQQGFVKVLDTSFMVNFMIVGAPQPSDVEKYFEAIRRAQRAIDEDQNRYKHYLLRDFPNRFHAMLDTGRCGIGERVVFDSYPDDLFQRTLDWVKAEKIL